MRLTNVRAVARIASHYMIAYDEIINNNTFFIIKFIYKKMAEIFYLLNGIRIL